MIDQELEGCEPPRAVGHFALLVLVGFAVVASLLLSERAPTLASFNNVAPGGPVPAGIAPTYGDDWSLVVHRSDWRPGIAAALGRTDEERPLRLGWVVREWSFLGLPLFAYRQSDLAAYRTDQYGYRVSALTVDEVAAIRARGGPGWFPWWRFAWGWLAVAAVAGFAVAELRWQARRRTALGVM